MQTQRCPLYCRQRRDGAERRKERRGKEKEMRKGGRRCVCARVPSATSVTTLIRAQKPDGNNHTVSETDSGYKCACVCVSVCKSEGARDRMRMSMCLLLCSHKTVLITECGWCRVQPPAVKESIHKGGIYIRKHITQT